MEKVKVTKEQALGRVKDNYEVIDTAYGRIWASKKFFAVTGTIGAISAGVAVGSLFIVGFTLLPVAVTGLGVAAAVASSKFYGEEKQEEARMEDADKYNQRIEKRIETKSKVKTR